ncbi:hypothetical protein [Embleya scabrispora]|uniref:hypothetical protein n=1 Tax=Embleya scabrispora TaxID=159449 RepID=UPI00037343F5|nr:hypothetical protein [Embleya scabrispora]
MALTAAALTAAAAGCTVEEKDKPTTPVNGPAAGAAAVAPGVTADSIKIGVAYPDTASIKVFTNIDLGDYEAAYKAR